VKLPPAVLRWLLKRTAPPPTTPPAIRTARKPHGRPARYERILLNPRDEWIWSNGTLTRRDRHQGALRGRALRARRQRARAYQRQDLRGLARRSPPHHDATGQRAYTGTRITRAGSVRYEHDVAGRIVLRQKTRLSRKPDTWRYTWDAEDRLTSVVTPDGARRRYQYDPLGRRIAKQRLADDEGVLEETTFTWDGHTLCEQTQDRRPTLHRTSSTSASSPSSPTSSAPLNS
jgi:YD repeat-containing protein